MLGSADRRSTRISDDAHVTAVCGNVSTSGGSDAGPMRIIDQVGRIRIGPFISSDRAPCPPMPGISQASAAVCSIHNLYASPIMLIECSIRRGVLR